MWADVQQLKVNQAEGWGGFADVWPRMAIAWPMPANIAWTTASRIDPKRCHFLAQSGHFLADAEHGPLLGSTKFGPMLAEFVPGSCRFRQALTILGALSAKIGLTLTWVVRVRPWVRNKVRLEGAIYYR